MPAFVFVSGMLSKSYIAKGAPQMNKLCGYFVLYFAYKFLLWIIDGACFGIWNKFDFISEGSAPWYMMAMILWLLILPAFAQMKPYIGLVLSLFIGMVAPICDGLNNVFAISRVSVFMFFFIAGYYFKYEYVEKIKKPIFYAIALAILIGFGLLIIGEFDFVKRFSSLIWADKPYIFFKDSIEIVLAMKLAWYAVICLIIFALLVLCPVKKMLISKIGQNTLAIYIFHRLIRSFFDGFNLYKYYDDSIVEILCVSVAVSIVLTIVFSEKHINKLVNLPFKIIKDR